MNRTAFLLAFTLLACTAASAQETDNNFEGLYGGLEAGALFGQEGQNGQSTQSYIGGTLGYRQAFSSNWVLGLEASLGKAGSPAFDPTILSEDVPFITDNKYEWSLSATTGYLFGAEEKNLAYAKLGILNQRREVYDLVPCPPGLFCIAAFSPELITGTDTSLLLGLGYERALTDTLHLRLSADYANTAVGDTISTKAGLVFQF